MEGKYQNNILQLPELDQFRYENIFKVYQTGEKNYFYYNIVKKIEIPDDIEQRFFNYITLQKNMPLTAISYDIYGTMELWWLLLIVNNIQNPVKNLPSGEKIKYILPEIVPSFVENIKSQL
tara:strand:- start:215 stop:577 length:363 start_codon:yes stop_codon:yes gene_type:complete